MNKQYRELFQLVARNGAISCENAIEVFSKDTKDHEEEMKTLRETKTAFNKIEDKLIDGKDLESGDYFILYTGALVTFGIMNKNINTWTAVANEYKDNLIPKLKEISLETNNDKKETLIEEYFS